MNVANQPPPKTLREMIDAPDILVVPGVYDGLSALMAQDAGFGAVYLSGASIAYTRFGRPDIGLVSMTEVAETLEAIRERIDVPVIVDADTGFGNALNVFRTTKLFERVGASAIQIEDQTTPKRCGHLDEKTLIGTAEMAGKIRAALDAREGDCLVIARTDAVAVEGLEPALERAAAYREAGADVLFIEALRSEEEISRAMDALAGSVPLMANMVEGGKTPLMDAQELQALGYSLVIFPGGLVRAVSRTIGEYFESLKASGTTKPFLNRMNDFKALQAIVGTDEMLALGKKYDDGEKR